MQFPDGVENAQKAAFSKFLSSPITQVGYIGVLICGLMHTPHCGIGNVVHYMHGVHFMFLGVPGGVENGQNVNFPKFCKCNIYACSGYIGVTICGFLHALHGADKAV